MNFALAANKMAAELPDRLALKASAGSGAVILAQCMVPCFF